MVSYSSPIYSPHLTQSNILSVYIRWHQHPSLKAFMTSPCSQDQDRDIRLGQGALPDHVPARYFSLASGLTSLLSHWPWCSSCMKNSFSCVTGTLLNNAHTAMNKTGKFSALIVLQGDRDYKEIKQVKKLMNSIEENKARLGIRGKL